MSARTWACAVEYLSFWGFYMHYALFGPKMTRFWHVFGIIIVTFHNDCPCAK